MFFRSWKLWEKLVFILGCSFVLVIMMGCIKLIYAHWRLRRDTVFAEKERREDALRRQMRNAKRSPGMTKAGEVLFGVRAIESGVEIGDLWISRPNTPELPGHEVSRSSWGQESCSKMQHHVVEIAGLAQTRHTGHAAKPKEKSWQEQAHSPRYYSGHAELSLGKSTQKVSAYSDRDSGVRKGSQLPLVCYSRCSNIPYDPRKSMVSSTTEGLDGIHRTSGYHHRTQNACNNPGTGSFSNHQSNIDRGIEPSNTTSVPPTLRNRPGPRCLSVDIAMLDEHRTSQAAETGQLTPRARRLAVSVDYGIPGVASSERLPLDYFDSPRARSSSRSSSPALESLPPAVLKTSIPEVTPFAQFVQNAPPSPRPLSVSSQSSRERKKSETTCSSVDDGSTLLALTPQSTPPEGILSQSQPSHNLPDKNIRRHSDILRGHGTGFEILRPGSLTIHSTPEEPLERRRASRPPVSLHNFVQTRSRSRSTSSSGRKLQKRRRQSFGSVYSVEA